MPFRKIQTTNLTSTETAFDDPLLVLNKSGSTAVDIGWLGKIGPSSYSGLVKDGNDGKFYVIDNVSLLSDSDNNIEPSQITLGTIVANVEFDNNMVLPKGPQSQRPASPVEGQMWFNTDTKMFEGYNGTEWVQLIPAEYVEE